MSTERSRYGFLITKCVGLHIISNNIVELCNAAAGNYQPAKAEETVLDRFSKYLQSVTEEEIASHHKLFHPKI